MSNFLGRVGQITEWVVVSNLENRAVNAACDKAQDWWKNRKQPKHDTNKSSASSASPLPPPPPPLPPSQSQANYPMPLPQYQPQQASYASPSQPVPTSMGSSELLIGVNQIDGLNQCGPLIVTLECNHQRYQARLGQYQQQFSFPIYQFDYDELFIWIQTEYQQQTVASGNIPIRVLLNNTNSWTPQQQRWIPLRDYYNGPVGQLLVTIEYKTNHQLFQQTPAPPPPPYSYYP
ncbi:unnamed protein product [Rotaria socialis]